MGTSLSKQQKKVFFKLTWPLFFEVALGLVAGYVVAYMLSHYSQDANAVVSVSGQLISMFYLVFQIISAGTSIMMAQWVGAKVSGIKEKIAAVSILFAAILGIVGTAVIILFGRQLLGLLNLDASLMKWGTDYILIIGSFFIMQAVSFCVAQMCYSYGQTMVGMVGTLVANIVNIILDYALIFGVPALGIPSLGVAGAAIGSVVGRVIYFIFVASFLRTKMKFRTLPKELKPFPKKVAKKLITIGLPANAESMTYSLSQLVVVGFVIALGSTAIVAKTYYDTIAVIDYVIASAVSSSCAILVGQFIGEGKIEDTRAVVKHTLKISIISTLLPTILLIFFIGPVGRIFTNDEAVIAEMKTIAIFDFALEMFRSINLVLTRSLKATGDEKYTMVVAIIEQWGFMVPLAIILFEFTGLGIVGIWIVLAADEGIRCIFNLFRWRSHRWETKALTSEPLPNGVKPSPYGKFFGIFHRHPLTK